MIHLEQWQRKPYENIFMAYDAKKLVIVFNVQNAVEEKKLQKVFTSTYEFYKYIDAFEVECGLMNFRLVLTKMEEE